MSQNIPQTTLEESDARATRGNSGVKRGEKAGVKGVMRERLPS